MQPASIKPLILCVYAPCIWLFMSLCPAEKLYDEQHLRLFDPYCGIHNINAFRNKSIQTKQPQS